MSVAAVQAVLAAAAPVAAIAGDRVYYSVAPQGAARPYIVLITTAESDETLLAGAAEYPETLISVVAYADDFPTVDRLNRAIIAALQNATGTFRGWSITARRDGGGAADFLPADRAHRVISNFAVRARRVP